MTNNKDRIVAQDIWILVTAHPDDESMFFIPTLRNLLSADPKEMGAGYCPGESPIIQVLCLSNGDYRDVADGTIRTQEIYKACSFIGIQNPQTIPKDSSTNDGDTIQAVTVLDNGRMKDGPNEVWSTELIAKTVMEHVRKVVTSIACVNGKLAVQTKSSPSNGETQSWNFVEKKSMKEKPSQERELAQSINVNLLTFDQGGVSGHPNHVDVFLGVRFLVNEKCHITRTDSESVATLRLRQQQKVNTLSGNTIDVNVRAFTLKTIANPLKKYFFWAFVDLIPFFLVWLFQGLRYLIYFLLGGFLFSKRDHLLVSGIQLFTRTKTTSDGNLQCRIMNPYLVWRAMAAHHSQFVWYRRLSVIFSRYTYINDLNKLSIDTPPLEEDDDEYIASLPPVVAIKEDKSSPKFLFTPRQMNALREAVIPTGLHHRPWKRIYSLSRDGDSFIAFQKLVGDWNGKQGQQSTLLIVKTIEGELIGGYADVPFIVTASNTIGSASRSCLFRMENDVITVYGKQHSLCSKKIILDSTRRIIAFGGGSTGKSDEGFGMCLEDGFSRGTTARCEAFGNAPLVKGHGGVFDVLDVEVWGFVFGQF